jgi:hypothetical protein
VRRRRLLEWRSRKWELRRERFRRKHRVRANVRRAFGLVRGGRRREWARLHGNDRRNERQQDERQRAVGSSERNHDRRRIGRARLQSAVRNRRRVLGCWLRRGTRNDHRASPRLHLHRVVFDNGTLYWSDVGHGTIKSLTTSSRQTTAMVSGISIAAVQAPSLDPQVPGGPLTWRNGPLATVLLERGGTVYWIGATEALTLDEGGVANGGVGTAIFAAAPGTAPTMLLQPEMAPGPSPVSASDAGDGLETPGIPPPINAMALSPDGSTLYFAAGTRFYSIPAAGAASVADVKYIGATDGPEAGLATALAADASNLYYPTYASGHVEALALASLCTSDAALIDSCPPAIAKGQFDLAYDQVLVSGGAVLWGNSESLEQSEISQPSEATIWQTAYGSPLTGFALGEKNVYLAENSPEGSAIERSAIAADANAVSSPVVIAVDQPWPKSLALDGTNVYWRTARCDIMKLADSPQ